MLTKTLFDMKGYKPQRITDTILSVYPEAAKAIARVKTRVPYIKRQISYYQGYVLYALAHQYDFADSCFLEVGTAWGFSAACMAEGAPDARIETLNPKMAEVIEAKKHLSEYRNIEIFMQPSMQYYNYISQTDRKYDLVFVDGNHDKVEDDLKFWNLVRPGGLMLFHDYSPEESWRPCRQVYDCLNDWLKQLGRKEFDVIITDDRGAGMVGLIKE